ncbi:hypothetical protein OGAPHI_004977 [Ogataea philodendri]|uniref:Uncharacterized protein n=1 Tax=Ogataea philodendri TaxID=1378263 RepID=A0A9P8T395_9ASCO|nr:uncharacterized protein OGAPHI_004977 [Ogataea philodendri]KAH3663576.1 hypothetical protein OGAPHI_004977 [Ogataea philodendri]
MLCSMILVNPSSLETHSWTATEAAIKITPNNKILMPFKCEANSNVSRFLNVSQPFGSGASAPYSAARKTFSCGTGHPSNQVYMRAVMDANTGICSTTITRPMTAIWAWYSTVLSSVWIVCKISQIGGLSGALESYTVLKAYFVWQISQVVFRECWSQDIRQS